VKKETTLGEICWLERDLRRRKKKSREERIFEHVGPFVHLSVRAVYFSMSALISRLHRSGELSKHD
jgi:hypothetical protein